MGKFTTLEATAGLVLYVAGGVNETVGDEVVVNGVTTAVVVDDATTTTEVVVVDDGVVGADTGEVLDGVEGEVFEGDAGVGELNEGVELVVKEELEVVVELEAIVTP